MNESGSRVDNIGSALWLYLWPYRLSSGIVGCVSWEEPGFG